VCPVILGTLLSFLIYGHKRAEVSYRKRFKTKEIHYRIEGYNVLPSVGVKI